jgi:hypothetical protein
MSPNQIFSFITWSKTKKSGYGTRKFNIILKNPLEKGQMESKCYEKKPY